MKKILLFASLLVAGMTAWAQDTSGWEKGQDVTDQLQWKATTGPQEDVDNPVWQGFEYNSPKTEWEFRDNGAVEGLSADQEAERATYICWGVYNIATWNVYQSFEIPAGVYTVKLAGAYREGSTGPSFDLWKAGKKTNNAFLYVKVGEETYETPLMYFHSGAQEEPLFTYDGWQNDHSFDFTKPDGSVVKIYGPSCHWGADKYLENGNWNWNELLFIVPEKTTITVGIDKRVAQSQDQVWWNEWRMVYEMPYDEETSKALVAYNDFKIAKDAAENFAESVINAKMGTLGAIMMDEIMTYEDTHKISKTSPVADLQAAVAEMKEIDVRNRDAYAKTLTMKFVIEVGNGMLKVTDYPGKAAFEAAIKKATDVLYDEENLEATVQDYLDAGAELNKARIDYILSQEKEEDGGYDFTHAISNPWFVNQEFTPTKNGTQYAFSEELENTWFDGNVVGDNVSFEVAQGELAPISDKAHWTTDPAAEEQWVYTDKWDGWHGGFKNAIVKVGGYPCWYSDWAAGPNENGAMTLVQTLNALPKGFYTLEGFVYAQSSDDWAKVNQYMFINDAEGNEITRVKNEVQGNMWGGFTGYKGRDGWSALKTDFVQVPAGKVTVGFSQNTMSAVAGIVMRYYGEELDYNVLVQKKIAESKPEEGELWAADQAKYDEMIAAVKFPIADDAAYAAALEQVNAAIAFKNEAAAAVKAYDLDAKYTQLMNDEAFAADDDLALQVSDILTTAQMDILLLGEGENDSYTDIKPARDIYNAYASYVNVYAKAKLYDNETANKTKIEGLLKEQYDDLKDNVATPEKLDLYARQLTAPMNEDIFNELGAATASEADPTNITSLIVNPSLADGPKTGWTLEGEDVNPSINTYGRELAECWNQKPFKISQTLFAMPEGAYKLRVRACYRDGGDPDQAMEERTLAGTNQFAFLFAETDDAKVDTPVKNITEGGWEDPSFTKWWNAKGSEEAQAAGFQADWDGTICILPGEESVLSEDDLTEGTLQELDPATAADGGHYPFDYKRAGKWYPASMAGFKLRIEQTDDAYVNEVTIMVKEAQNLTIGFEKIDAKGGDWLIYDDFELYYLGTEVPTGINNVNVAGKGNAQYFSVNGVRLSAPQKGLNIVKENGKVRKVYIK